MQFPAAYHPMGSQAQCTHISIPQVAETYGVMGHSPGWVWGYEQGVNEHAVAIGNHSVFSREPLENEPGLIGMDLVRLGLERGRDAREALEVIATLIEQHGQAGSARGPGEAGYHNAFLLADPAQAWQMETSGRRWAARKVDLAVQSNHLSMRSNWLIGSRDLESFARLQGWWGGRDRLDLAAAYRDPDVQGAFSAGRSERGESLLEASRGKHDVTSLVGVLRDHGETDGIPNEVRREGDSQQTSICMHAEPVGTTTASLVAALPENRSRPWPVWASFGSPCLGIFLPLYMDGWVPDSLASGGGVASPGAGPSAWAAFSDLRNAVDAAEGRPDSALRASFDALSEQLEEERILVEREVTALQGAGEEVEAAAVLSAFMATAADRAIDTAVTESNRLRRSMRSERVDQIR